MSDANTDETTFAAAARAAVRLDVKCRNLESQNQALQERAEKAEALLRELADALYDRRIYDNSIPQYEPTRNRKEVRLIHALNAARALSPTQETDPE